MFGCAVSIAFVLLLFSWRKLALFQQLMSSIEVGNGVGGVRLDFNVNLDSVSIAVKIDVVVSDDMTKQEQTDKKQDGPKH